MVIVFGAKADGLRFLIRQKQIPFLRFPVAAFARLTAQDEDTAVSPAGFQLFPGHNTASGGAEIIKQHVHNGIGLEKIDPLPLRLFIGVFRFGIGLLEVRDPAAGGDLKAPVLQSLQDRDGMALVDLAGAGTALDGHGRTGTVQHNLFGLKGQRTVIFQQHHGFAGSLIGYCQILLLPLGDLTGIAGFG